MVPAVSRDNVVTSQRTDHQDAGHGVFDHQTPSTLTSREDQNNEPSLQILDYPPPQPEGRAVELDDLLMLERTELLLTYCVLTLFSVTNNPRLTSGYLDDQVICPHQIALPAAGADNPYQVYILPLAYEQIGLLYAVLGLTACHMGINKEDEYLRETLAVEYRVRAIRWLGETLRNGISGELDENERDGIFITIQILLLQDVSSRSCILMSDLDTKTELNLSEDFRIGHLHPRSSYYRCPIDLQPVAPV